MKIIIRAAVFIIMLAGMACISPASIAATSGCAEIYYSADDLYYQRPLQQPDPEFMKSYKLAKAGNVIEQRNVAVSYDAGYLVSACPEKAHYWYQKAANNGDLIAQDWIVRYNKFQAMFDGPEFAIRNDPPQVLASASAASNKLSKGSSQQPQPPQQADPGSLLERYAKYEQQMKDPASGYGQLVNIGQMLGGFLPK